MHDVLRCWELRSRDAGGEESEPYGRRSRAAGGPGERLHEYAHSIPFAKPSGGRRRARWGGRWSAWPDLNWRPLVAHSTKARESADDAPSRKCRLSRKEVLFAVTMRPAVSVFHRPVSRGLEYRWNTENGIRPNVNPRRRSSPLRRRPPPPTLTPAASSLLVSDPGRRCRDRPGRASG